MDKIVILENLMPAKGVGFRVAFRFQVKAGREAYYANPEAGSSYALEVPGNIAALQAGQYVEWVRELTDNRSLTQPSVATALEGMWAKFDAEFQNDARFNRYGTVWNGSVWTAKEI